MKQWTKEDLILFYYAELDNDQVQKITHALSESNDLQCEYDELCRFLDVGLNVELPEPDENLNQKIMAGIYQAELKKRQATALAARVRNDTNINSVQRILQWLSVKPSNNFVAVSIALTFAVVAVFLLGRWSAEPVEQLAIDTNNNGNVNTGYGFDEQASRRILLTNVSAHMETSQRLLTRVSNGDDAVVGSESRSQLIEELIGFNRLYRRLAEQSDDQVLADVLQQIETVLLEINHSNKPGFDRQRENIRERLDSTDLIFKLKVTNQKLNQKISL